MSNVPQPHNELQKLLALQLYRSPRIGPRSYRKLLNGMENFDEALDRLISISKRNKIANYQPASIDVIREEFRNGKKYGAELVFEGMARYPSELLNCEDRPPMIWLKGDQSLLDRPSIAIIGSRNPSIEGVRMARHFARELSNSGFCVVSGLARGIDTAAHQGSVANGTIAVVAGGIDVHYPRSNAQLQEQIADRGLILSEMPFGHQPQQSNFPQRNRIIAALCDAVLVVEAGLRSGTRITVDLALGLGRRIFAIPGSPFHGLSALPNQLIRDGAELILTPEDVIDAIGDMVTRRPTIFNLAEKPAAPKPVVDPPNFVTKPPPAEHSPAAPNHPNYANLGHALLNGRAYQSLDGAIRRLPSNSIKA